ncbi:hypothetical protein [Flavobacterium rhizosphaerae]|uniref:SdiA-regulated family protein n=1 Tax=Flavobacterium rhizosphaerae TaxID=3163298 RepID=A0ABW8YU14_9FLAO
MAQALKLVLVCIIVYGCSCKTNSPLKETATLNLDEVSGLEYVNGTLWALQDSGNKNKLYQLDPKTGEHKSFTIKNSKNNDWESLASDAEGNLYIGDFGNNDNDRKDLVIYKVNSGKPERVEYTIHFSYPEQTEFPPKKSKRVYDCEAFFEYQGYFYLFSKNRSIKGDGSVNLYKLQNKRGSQKAQLMGSFITCNNNYRKCAIAGADISPDGKTVALISGDKVWLITNFKGDDFPHGTLTPYEIGELTQKEGICFIDNDNIYIADEREKNIGGKLYTLKINDLKTNN